ncbi:hypothetical protein [Rosistilla oblonga]|uniref:hypothetical protein n=1 Tax=Rosistilla oblonga TaxID=2527990 RepID=UPI003A971223
MFGPVFNREAILAPKRTKTYLARSLYALGFFLLLSTGYLVLAGNRPLQTAGDSARFGGWMFALLVPLQLIIVTFQAAIGSASNIAQEKDRRTLILLLLSRLTGFELVVGKLAASLIPVVQSLAAGVPLFLAIVCLGGVSLSQFAGAYGVTCATALLAASIGVVIALWREKTFQTIAVTLLAIALWVAAWEVAASGSIPMVPEWLPAYASPVQALQSAIAPIGLRPTAIPVTLGFGVFTLAISAAITALGVWKIRVWNPSREVRVQASDATEEAAEEKEASLASTWKVREARAVWNNPILWREVCTWAYGRKVLVIRFAYLLLVALAAAALAQVLAGGLSISELPPGTLPLAAIGVISLAIVNALAVNSVTSERDGLALDLLLATDIEPKEFLFGKILGVLFVAKEMVVLPLVLAGYVWYSGGLSGQNFVFTMIATAVLYLFVIVLGIHCGLNYANSRTALLTSLGTFFFLCLGIAICMVIMVSFRGAFQLQLAPFLAIILGGGAGLLASLGRRNPSPAISLASFGLPFATFYAITTFLLQRGQLWVLVAVGVGYGFATLAMLIPALSDFDVAMGRSHSTTEESE